MNAQKFPFEVIDLTHTLSPDIPTWDGDCGFDLSIEADYKDCTPPDIFRTQNIKLGAGTGTHMDAPAHTTPDGRTIEELKISELVVDCLVIKINGAGEDFIVTPQFVEEFEKNNGTIQPNTFVIFNTGWSKHWEEKGKYHNGHKFPSVHEDTAKMLVERNIAGLGIDTLSADTGETGFPVHRVILGSGKYLVENIANSDLLPPTGAKVLVLPMKIKGATEAPIRLVALLPQK